MSYSRQEDLQGFKSFKGLRPISANFVDFTPIYKLLDVGCSAIFHLLKAYSMSFFCAAWTAWKVGDFNVM